jgi:hypothetical protein
MAFVAVTIGLTSCEDEETPVDESPVITIAEPMEGETVNSGDTLHIEWSATTVHDLHEAMVVLNNVTAGAIAFSDTPEVHGLTSFNYHEHVVPTVSADSDFKLTVTVSDHEGNESTKEVNLHVHP